MAGIADVVKLDEAKSAAEATSLCDHPGISYARIFAESGCSGPKEAEAYQEAVKHYGEGRASSLRAVCWFLHWASYTGNTLNSILGFKKVKDDMSTFFKLTFLTYYFPLFFILINVVSLIVKPLPRVPTWFSAGFGFILATIAGSSFFPLGVIGLVLDAKNTKSD